MPSSLPPGSPAHSWPTHRAVDLMDAKPSEAARRSRGRFQRAAAGGLGPLTVSLLRQQDASMRPAALSAELGGNYASGQKQ